MQVGRIRKKETKFFSVNVIAVSAMTAYVGAKVSIHSFLNRLRK